MSQRPHRDPTPDGAPTMGDVLELPDPLRALVLWMLRHGEAGVGEVMAVAGLEEGPCRDALETLVGRGFLSGISGDGAPRYRVRLAARRPRPAGGSVWDRL